jgi:hypothetical protein
MTAVPKPLKFLRPHYDELSELYEKWAAGPVKVGLGNLGQIHKLSELISPFLVLGLAGRYALCARYDLR